MDFKSETFVIKSIICLSNFINQDYLVKPWNRSNHFGSFISTKKQLSLKDHRFNRLSECALTLLFHLDVISNYLGKYVNIVNGVSILDRPFVEMEVLKRIYSEIALLGSHMLKPY